jgi:transposase
MSVTNRETAAEVRRLAKMLRRRDGLTARDVAERLGVSRPTAYAAINRLATYGYELSVRTARAGLRGPMAKHYRVVGKAEAAPCAR